MAQNKKSKLKTAKKSSAKAKTKVVAKAKKPVAAKATKSKTKATPKKKVNLAKKPVAVKKTAKKSAGLSKAKASPKPKAPAKPTTTSKKTSAPKGVAWMQPLDDRILVEIADSEQVTPGGIVLIDSSNQPENMHGYVVAVGRGHQSKKGRIRPIEVKAGDKIIFSKYAGDKVSYDGVNFVIIRETEVLGFAAN